MVKDLLNEFPEKAGRLYNYAYCIKNLMGDGNGAIKLMREAAENDCWSDPVQLMEDPDLESLRSDPRFTEIISVYAKMAEKSRNEQTPILRIIEPRKVTKGETASVPLIIALHGNNQSAEDALEEWQFMSEKGWLVAIPQSSQESMPGAYVWSDFSVSIPELKDHYQKLKDTYNIDEEKSIIAGFSMGGALAAKVCFEQIIPCRNLILVGPYIKNPSELEKSIEEFGKGRGRGYILVGDHDSDCLGGSKELFKILQKSGIDAKIEILENLYHEYPAEFQTYAERLLEFFEEP